MNSQALVALIVYFYPALVLAQSSLIEQRKHEKAVRSIAWSQDSKRLISGDVDGIIKIWDMPSQSLLRTFAGHQSNINQVGYSPDGSYFAFSGGKTVMVCNATTGRPIKTFKEHLGRVENLIFHPRKKLIASSSADSILIWHYPGGRVVKTLIRSKQRVSGLTFSFDGQYLASYNSLGEILVWDINSGKVVKKVGEFKGFISSFNHQFIRFTPDGKNLVTKLKCNSFVVWGLTVSGGMHEITWNEKKCIVAMDVHTSGDIIAVSGEKGQVNLYSLPTGRRHLTIESTWQINRLAWSPDGKYLAGATSDGMIIIWDVKGTLVKKFLPFSPEEFFDVETSSNGEFVVSGGKQGYFRLWQLTTGSLTRSPPIHKGAINDIAISPDNQLILTGGKDKKITISTVPGLSQLTGFEGHDHSITAVEWSHDGKRYASGDEKGIVKIWDADSHELIRSFGAESRWKWPVISFSWSPDGRYLATGYYTSHYQVWDIQSGVLVRTIRGYTERVAKCPGNGFIQFSPTGDYIAGATLNCEAIVIWNNFNGRVHKVLGGLSATTPALIFSNDEKYLVSAGDDHIIRIWRIDSGLVTKKLSAGSGGFCSVNLSPNGKWIISGEYEGRIRIWDLNTGVNVFTLSLLKDRDDYILYKHQKPVSGTDFAIKNFLKTSENVNPKPTSAYNLTVSKTLPVIKITD